MTARLCYCAAAPGSTHSCLVASDFLVDAGEVGSSMVKAFRKLVIKKSFVLAMQGKTTRCLMSKVSKITLW